MHHPVNAPAAHAPVAPQRLEVQVAKANGCLLVVGGLMSFGVVPLVILLPRRRWPRFFDPSGMTLRNGSHIPWDAFTSVRRVRVHGDGGAVLAERIDLRSSRGKVQVVTSQIHNAQAVEDFLFAHLPERAHFG